MDLKKRRSSLRKLPPVEEDEATRSMAVKRRISFSGKKFVREFDNMEKPKMWDNSYELSDHTNGEDSSGKNDTPHSIAGLSKDYMSKSSQDRLFTLNKENITLANMGLNQICDRTQADMTLNLQSSINLTLLAQESKKQARISDATLACDIVPSDSFSLSESEREKLQGKRNSCNEMEKTIDFMLNSYQCTKPNDFRRTINKEQCIEETLLHKEKLVSKTVCHDNSMDLTLIDRGENLQCTPQKPTSQDSFMDITPLGLKIVNEAKPYKSFANKQSDVELKEHRKTDCERISVMEQSKSMFTAPDKRNQTLQRKTMLIQADKDFGGTTETNKRKTILFENFDVEESIPLKDCSKASKASYLHIDSDKEVAYIPGRADESFDFEASSTINYLGEDSLLSSPLIPLDLISANRINKKLNFQQLNDEIESGRIQVFPKGPKTPTTDRKAQSQHFWQGIDNHDEQSKRAGNSIKPRATLNFSEDMLLSPHQREFKLPKAPLTADTADAVSKKTETCGLQADEMMLDNSNCLTLANIENVKNPQSRIGLNVLPRPEMLCNISTTQSHYYTTKTLANEANPPTKLRKTLHVTEPMDESSFCVVAQSNPAETDRDSKFEQLVQKIEENSENFNCVTKTFDAGTSIQIGKPSKSRQTMLMNVSIEDKGETIYGRKLDENVVQAEISPVRATKESRKPRHTVNMVESMVEEAACELTNNLSISRSNIVRTEISPVKATEPRKPRHTVNMVESMEEDSLCESANNISISTLNVVPDKSSPVKATKPRHTVNMVESMEEDALCELANNISISTLNVVQAKSSPVKATKEPRKPRNTVNMVESMEEEALCELTNNISISILNDGCSEHMADPIEENTKIVAQTVNAANVEVPVSIEQLTIDASIAGAGNDMKLRLTVNTGKAMKGDSLDSPTNTGVRSHTKHESDLILEMTPQRNRNSKSQLWHLKYSPFTPARSFIEYEENEEICNQAYTDMSCNEMESSTFKGCADSCTKPGAPMKTIDNVSEQCSKMGGDVCNAKTKKRLSVYQPVNMDIENDSNTTPITFKTVGHHQNMNSKRLSIDLTPILPQPKKRYTAQYLENDIDTTTAPTEPAKSDNSFVIELDTSQNEADQSLQISAKKKSRIPILSIKGSDNSLLAKSPTIDLHSNNLDADFSVQVPRKYVSRQTRSVIEIEDAEIGELKAPSPVSKRPSIGEDNPITISDVSVFFLTQRQLAKQSVPSTNEPLNITARDSRSSNEPPFQSIAIANRNFMNLSSDDTLYFSAGKGRDSNEIDNVRLSLVSNLLDDDEVDVADLQEEAVLSQEKSSSDSGEKLDSLDQKACKLSVGEAEHSTDSFGLSYSSTFPDLGLSRLRRLRLKPRIANVHKYWDIKALDRLSNAIDESVSVEDVSIIQEPQYSLPKMLKSYEILLQRYKETVAQQTKVKSIVPFTRRLELLMHDQSPSWIFDYQLSFSRKFIFTNRKIPTFCIVIDYQPVDILETSIKVRSIKLDSGPTPMESWCAVEHLLDFQMSLKFPLNLMDLIDGDDEYAILKFLQRIDNFCAEVLHTYKKFNSVLISSKALLLRERNISFVRKTVRQFAETDLYLAVKKTDFTIEISNLHETSFMDVLNPPLYHFKETIQNLPKGVGFLEEFLMNPLQYIKQSANI